MGSSTASGARLWLLSGAVAIAFLAAALPGLAHYGPTWDLVIGEYGYGHQWLAWAMTGDGSYLEAADPPRMPSLAPPHPDFQTVGRFPARMVYPLGAMLSALSCDVLWTAGHVLPAMEAHHLPVLLFFAALLATLTWVGARRIGPWGAAGAVAAALCSPRLFAHGFHNLKDFPEGVLYAWTYLAAAAALAGGRSRAWIGVGALWGLALAQKANALFVPVQALAFLILANVVRRRAGRPRYPWPWSGALLVLLIAPVAWLLVSPHMWQDTLARLGEHLGFIVNVGTTQVASGAEPTAGLVMLVTTTPVPVLLLALLGLCSPRLGAETRVLLLLGVAVPLGRTLLPLRYHGGLRQILELMPFVCLLAGAGLQFLAELVAARLSSRGAAALATSLLAALLFAPGAWGVAASFPHGVAWFNALAGGLSGAQQRGVHDATDEWANSYWDGLDWLSENAEPGAALMVPTAWHVAASAAPVRLRADVNLLPERPPRTAQPPLYVMTITRVVPESAVVYRWLRTTREPVHEVRVQGAPILLIYRFEHPAEVDRVLSLQARWRRAQPLLREWMASAHPEWLADPAWMHELLAGDALERLSSELGRETDPRWAPLALELAELDALAGGVPPELDQKSR